MMAQELGTAAAYGVKLTVVLVDNGGYASIGDLSERVGASRLGTAYPTTSSESEMVPWDLGANAESLGARLFRVSDYVELTAALSAAAKVSRQPVVIHVRTSIDRGTEPVLDSGVRWDVPSV
jgi:3D-(3,5/4)-trihydroxycyclohexane-1,2-dione acylhydrolase (decyclizing)